MKKLTNLIALVMLVSTNVLTPFSYAQVKTPELIPENEVGNVEEIGEAPEKDNEITEEILNSLGEVEGEGNLPLVREVVNESEPEELKEEVEDSLDDVESPTTDENKDEDTEKGESDEVAQQEEENTKIEKQEEILEDNNEITEQENVEAEIQELQKIQEISTMDTATNSKNIVLQATATAANQTLKINKYFAKAYTVDWGDGSPVETVFLDRGNTHTYATSGTYTITLSTTADRWAFEEQGYPYKPLVPKNGTTVTGVKITYMPSLASGFGNSEINPGNYFFYYFNYNGALTSLPEGSFDTSNITTVGKYFFMGFNDNGLLTSLPEGSFDTSNITTVGDNFFTAFNDNGKLTSLPEGSFRFSTGLTTAGFAFFSSFNKQGQLTSLPKNSFDTSNITTAGAHFFASFNSYGKITSLPKSSFNTSNITAVGYCFFDGFNRNGLLTSLPEGSFDTSKITTVGDEFFEEFNYNGSLTSLPEGSFDTSKITTVGDEFFGYFNYNGAIESLPDSFKLNSMAYNKSSSYQSAFNSPNYTLNKKVSDLVSGVTAPNGDRNTFSDNQPGRCGVKANWLVNVSNACSIIYNANGGIGTITGGYISNSTRVIAGSGIVLPTKEGYALSEWRDISGNRVDEVIFPDMDGETLYAQWEECDSGYVVNSTGTLCVLKEYTITYNLGGGYLEDRTGNKYEGNQVVTYTYNSTGNKYVSNLERELVKRENSKFLGWYSSGGELFDFGTISPEKMAFAKYECDLGYIENEEGTVCERIRVEFDANGGNFEGGENIFQKEISVVQVPNFETKISHTPNLTDEGEYETDKIDNLVYYGGTYGGVSMVFYQPAYIDSVKIEGAESLNLNIKYAGNICGWSSSPVAKYFWSGEHLDYGDSNTSTAEFFISEVPSEQGTVGEVNRVVSGDSITIYKPSQCPDYGRFITVSGTGMKEVAEYPDDAFDNIPQPSRNGYKFAGWYLADGTEFNTGNISTGEVTKVYAKWGCADGYEDKGGECVKKSGGSSGGGGGGGGGGGSSSKTDTGSASSQTGNQINSNTGDTASTGTNFKEPETNTGSDAQTGSQQPLSPTDSSPDREQRVTPLIGGDGEARGGGTQTYTQEFQEAYEFAKGNGITTMPTIQKANMEGKLTRIAMAKMLSQYAMNVLGQKPANIITPKFNDVTDKQNSDYDDGVTLAYQLGIMGQNMPGNNFRPNDEVTRAEFATALSRMAYGTSDGEYKGTAKYYIHHMEKLVKEGIITNDDPNMKELRGYVMIMLMRSSK